MTRVMIFLPFAPKNRRIEIVGLSFDHFISFHHPRGPNPGTFSSQLTHSCLYLNRKKGGGEELGSPNWLYFGSHFYFSRSCVLRLRLSGRVKGNDTGRNSQSQLEE